MKDKQRYDKAMEFAMKKRYFYLPDDNRYAMKEGGRYYWVNKGKVEFHQSYIDIIHGDIYAKEISEEEFNDAVEKSKNREEGYL